MVGGSRCFSEASVDAHRTEAGEEEQGLIQRKGVFYRQLEFLGDIRGKPG